MLLLLQPPPHLLLQPLAVLLVVGHRRLHSAQLVQQLKDHMKGAFSSSGLLNISLIDALMANTKNIPDSFQTHVEP